MNDSITAKPLSGFLVKQASPSGNGPFGSEKVPQAYYRSRLFIVPFTTNPLVAAAGPLLSLLERLCVSPTLPAIDSIRENIEHELRAFHSRLHGKSGTEELDAIAHYLLCATIDEMLGKSYLRVYGQPAEFQAFTPLSHDNIGPEERFFDITAHIRERPNQYLDLIELAYYCLIAGFEGKQHARPDGRLILDNLIEELYQLIQQYRVNKAHQLFKENKKTPGVPTSHRQLVTLGGLALGLVLFGYLSSYILLENKARAIQFGHPIVAKLDE